MWIDKRGETKTAETIEITFLRNLVGYAFKDQIRNTVIRNEINIFNLNSSIQNNKLNSIHYVVRS
jgi:hypothetical protein